MRGKNSDTFIAKCRVQKRNHLYRFQKKKWAVKENQVDIRHLNENPRYKKIMA